MKRNEMFEMTVKGLVILMDKPQLAETETPKLLTPLLEDVVDAFIQPGFTVEVSSEWRPNGPSMLMTNPEEWNPPTDEMLQIPPILELLPRLQKDADTSRVTLGINAWTRGEHFWEGAGPEAVFVVWVQKGTEPFRSLHIRTSLFPRGLPQGFKNLIPDVDSRSINEPCYLMSARDVRNIFGGHYPEYWEFERFRREAEKLGWYEVLQYGNQILFRAKLAIRKEVA